MSKKLAIAIYIEDQLEIVYQTLQSIYAAEIDDFEVVLIADGVALPDDLERLPRTTILRFPKAVGAPKCLNAWIDGEEQNADVFLFLENGLVLAHNCVKMLLGVLASDPQIGLVGPSTNRCWNQQRVPNACNESLDHVHEIAEHLLTQFQYTHESLAPLYSLSDFCMAFKREVLNAVGGFDVGYGLGPCWEMDFHARVERAGFQGRLVKAAYACRTNRMKMRIEREALYFESNKRYYQDRLCALKLQGLSFGYEPHCKGDACEHFAPQGITQLHISRPTTSEGNWLHRKLAEPWPLVSCIMPTARRPHYIAQSIAYFLRQDYPARELIIVYDEDSDLPHGLPHHPNIRYCRMTEVESIGNKRNVAMAEARGDIIAMWDDDDWYGPQRLTRQVMPILLGIADITGCQYPTFLDLQGERFWTATAHIYQRMFQSNVQGGTLVYRADLYRRGIVFPNASLAEDAAFLIRAQNAGARLQPVPGSDIYVYIRHDSNSWRFPVGSYLGISDWREISPRPSFADDYAFYLRRPMQLEENGPIYEPIPMPEVVREQTVRRDFTTPLVSCIMPTANREQFVPQAIQLFLDQDYPHKELIIIDDGLRSVQHLVPDHEAIKYLRLSERHTIGAKRNIGCEMAAGELVMHWDDDDWVAPSWISLQVDALQKSQADLTGLKVLRFFDAAGRRAWQYHYPDDHPAWIAGATMCYRKTLWERNPFSNIDVGEDNLFVWSDVPKVVAAHGHTDLFASRIHSGNTSPKYLNDPRWHPIPYETIETMLGKHLWVGE